jgi:nucleotide-binding universal stress UspA family protein
MRIILPIDFSENSIKALEFALALADKKHGKITLVHVIEMVYDFASQASIALDSMHKDAHSMMKKLIEKYEASGVQMDYLIEEGTASITVARIAEELEATLIVMGTQGVSGIKKALIGSTTVSVLKEATCPILVVPAEANVSQINKITLALEFANHEVPFIDQVVTLSEKWGLALELLHVQTDADFKDELSALGIETYIGKNHPDIPAKFHTIPAKSAGEGLNLFLEKQENLIFVMCHQHKNLWDQLMSKSQSIEMAYHTKVPLLVMS